MSSLEPRRPRDHLFVVRVWSEENEASAGPRWRAQVTHVGTHERHYFTNYGELCDFLDRCRER